MTEVRSPGALTRLAYVVHPGSFSTLALFASSRELCELLWVAHGSELDGTERRLLARTGEVLDVDGFGIEDAAARIGDRQPDGILALADDKLGWTALVAARLGLAFHTPATALALTDKLVQRERFRAAGLVAPRSWVVKNVGDVEALAAELAFPVVLKPRLGEGSRDTVLAATFDELTVEFADAAARSAAARDFVVEEYIADATSALGGEGFAGYVSVESCVQRGAITHVAVTGRLPPAPPFRETGFFIPAALDEGQLDAVTSAAGAAAAALGVTTGCLHTEVKLTDAGPVVIEVNGRIGGGVPEMLDASAHVDFLRTAMRLALGEDSGITVPVPLEWLAYLFYVQAPATLHVVDRVEGLDAVRAHPGITEVILRNGPGSHVDWRNGNHGHVASVLGTARDHDELRRVHAFVLETLEIDGA